MGLGKTEAALNRCLPADGPKAMNRGPYFALPTQLSSESFHDRCMLSLEYGWLDCESVETTDPWKCWLKDQEKRRLIRRE